MHCIRATGVVLWLLTIPTFLAAQNPPRFVVDSGRIVSVDTSVYADIPTAELIALARARHLGRALQLNGYRARLFTRIEGRIGTSRFGRGLQMFAYETAANLSWRQPSEVRVEVVGARSEAARMPGIQRESWATWWSELLSDELWFSPSALGDEIQLMGLPDEDALHPLARDADAYYRYEIVDSVTVGMAGRNVRALAVRVEPTAINATRRRDVPRIASTSPDIPPDSLDRMIRRRVDSISFRARDGTPMNSREIERLFDDLPRGRDSRGGRRVYAPTLVSGEMWLDADSLNVVRLIVTFVGDNIWDDDEDSPTLVSIEADLEYGLHDGQHWLPLRQVLAATFKYRYLPGAILPATAVTTFSDYDLIDDSPVTFDVALDSVMTGRRVGAWRCPEPWEWDSRDEQRTCADRPFVKGGIERDGTHWEITVPPLDSLTAFDFDTEFEHNIHLASSRFLEDRLTGMAALSEVAAPQTLQGGLLAVDWSAALGVFKFNRVQGPSLGMAAALDPRVAFTRVRIGGRVGFSDLRPTGYVTWERDAPTGRFRLTGYRALHEREPWTDGTGIGNSLRALVAGHDEADYHLALGGALSYRTHVGPLRDLALTLATERHHSVATVAGSGVNDVFFGSGRFQTNPAVTEGDYLRAAVTKEFYTGPTTTVLGVEGWASRATRSGRVWGLVDVPFSVQEVLGRVRLKSGHAFGDALPQSRFRAGGPETVRGFGYGTRSGRDLWSAQFDFEWVVSQWWSPLVFADMGNTSYSSRPLVGLGVGATALSGWMRLDLAKGVNPSRAVRADLHFQIPLH